MRTLDLNNKKVVIWGTGREGVAAYHYIRQFLPTLPLTFVDEGTTPDSVRALDATLVDEPRAIEKVIFNADVIVKSPGVSLYHPLLTTLRSRNIPITSLLNLWAAEPRTAKTIYVTGTKGKSTTASLITHVLQGLHQKAAVVGNIGTPVGQSSEQDLDFIVLETSSYQAANFDGTGDIAVLTSLYPEHLDWHKTLDSYYRDKLNLLRHGKARIINADALPTLIGLGVSFDPVILANTVAGFHTKNGCHYKGQEEIGTLRNNHLSRHHNLVNVCLVLAVLDQLGFSSIDALHAMETFQGLPHRQQEIGTKNGILYVNDSISTTPQSSIAAMEVYQDKLITVILGGYDRGIDYTPLVDYLLQKSIPTVLCLGPSGQRITEALQQRQFAGVYMCADMTEVVQQAQQRTPKGGVVLLSPAAPSYGMFKNFEERGLAFARESGF